jgi:2-dehydropantoate 2-reductase
MMKIAIIGTGGVGGYFGGRMARAGNDVTFIARGQHLKAIQTAGLTVKSILGDFKLDSVKSTDRITDISEADLIILAVKAWQVKEVATELRPVIKQSAMVLPLQNGVLAVDELKEQIEGKHILCGLCRIMSKIESPGIIDHFGIEPAIIFGETDNSISERVLMINAMLTRSGIKSIISEDIESDLWKKFIPICVSGLLAVTKTTYGELREIKETRQMMVELINEIYLLSQKTGVHIEHDFPDKTISFIDTFPYNSTSSLTRDVWECKTSEIEYQNGTVVKLGKKFGVDTPINNFIYNCILPMELKARKIKASQYESKK